MRFAKQSRLAVIATSLMVLLLIAGVGPWLLHSQADKLPNRSLTLSNPKQGEQSTYTFKFDIPASTPIGSMSFQFCSDTPLIDTPCAAPIGLDVTTANLTNQSGETNFSLGPGTNSSTLILTRSPSATSPGTVSYTFSGVQNPSGEGTYFVRLSTYASTDASGGYTDAAGLAYVINGAIDISSTVPPYLLFCNGTTITNYDCNTATGDYINFGELSSQATKSANTQLVLATNDDDGYNVFVTGSTMTAGNSAIPALGSGDVSRPGVSQFGLNLAANTTPTVGDNVNGPGSGNPVANYAAPNMYRFTSGDQLIAAPGINDYRKYTVSYIINISKDQSPGIYVTTLTYVAVGNF